jgi:hypothetical protein
MDSTNPDLSPFAGRGGKLIVLEHMADYAQSPYAGIRYFQAVERKLGVERVADFMRLYTAPGVDHVGSGRPRMSTCRRCCLGRDREGPRRTHGQRAKLGGFSPDRAGTPPLPLARLAQIPGRSSGRGIELPCAQ